MFNTSNNSQEILSEIRRTNRLLTILVTEGKNQGDKIILLNQAGFSPKDVADILGITANQVSVTLHKSKSKGKPAKNQ